MKRVLILAVAAVLVLSAVGTSEAACGRLRDFRPVRGLLENKPVRTWLQNRHGAGACGTRAACNGTHCHAK